MSDETKNDATVPSTKESDPTIAKGADEEDDTTVVTDSNSSRDLEGNAPVFLSRGAARSFCESYGNSIGCVLILAGFVVGMVMILGGGYSCNWGSEEEGHGETSSSP
uniref:Uncharacterized protein n=1 Tax=Entomoneis paludosa TaxID=265537 RepID=A0A7S3DSH8_9STRA|mmetsp:Transcript_31913/g.66607  ORF Transcript_31913/g.66607 Transcript_31913/m.66607 type:complete len:107 (+) Transcript_31913:123-443(+)|eukprot:CAMPEP_0172446258 /NCGR_PEP_ID=MMETSP1065-20121228/5901_1 /TAXON_ID=265537 /ORGANISM="Amphiprora paludosa, Strain CCMP125" /LENGTH=106 /DNA_ID=CAMNT_0013197331 /DNA_START=99 /DNA_END=419 /DNA_ORIENTATION=+